MSRHTTSGNASVFYTFDERGNVAQRTSSTGAVLSTDLYDAYGARTSTAAQSDPFGYEGQAGYFTDSETGLILCTNRYYDPTAGRFLTRDPTSYNGGINLYSYTRNNPINRTDPTGFGPKQGTAPGQVTNPADSGVTATLVFDWSTPGNINYYQYKLTLEPGFHTIPDAVDVDWIQSANGWSHLLPNYKSFPNGTKVPILNGGYTVQPDGSASPNIFREKCGANHYSDVFGRPVNWPQGFGITPGALMKNITTQQALDMGFIAPNPPTLQDKIQAFFREMDYTIRYGF